MQCRLKLVSECLTFLIFLGFVRREVQEKILLSNAFWTEVNQDKKYTPSLDYLKIRFEEKFKWHFFAQIHILKAY